MKTGMLARFLVTGVVTAGIYFLLFYVLWQLLGLNYKLSVTLAYFVALLFHFSSNRVFTFANSSGYIGKQLGRYLLMVGLGYVLNIFLAVLAVTLMSLPPYVGMAVAVAATTFLNFLLSKHWVFRRTSAKAGRLDY